MLPHVWPGWGHVYTEESCPGCKGHPPTGATLPGEPYKTWRTVIHEKQKVCSARRDDTAGVRSSHPKPEIFSQVARNFILILSTSCMTLFTGTVISLLAGPSFPHNINTLVRPAGLTWESNLNHMLAWQTARRLPHIKKWSIQKKILHLHIFTMELLLVNAVKAGGTFKKWRTFEDRGANSSIYSNRLQGCVINLQRFLTKAAHCYIEHSVHNNLHSE